MESKEGSGRAYSRSFGEADGKIVSRMHALSISNGTMLEHAVDIQLVALNITATVDHIISLFGSSSSNLILCGNKENLVLKLKSSLNLETEPDFIVVDFKANKIIVVEMKSDSNFDTGKAKAIVETLESWKAALENYRQSFKNTSTLIETKVCCFFEKDKQNAVKGLKNKITAQNIYLGGEFCSLLGLNYQEICNLASSEELILKNQQEVAKDLIKSESSIFFEGVKQLVNLIPPTMSKHEFYVKYTSNK